MILGICSLIVAIASLLWVWIGAIKGQEVRTEALKGEINKDMGALELRISDRVGKLETQVLPICLLLTDVLKNEIPKWLHSPHTPEFDRLLEKIPTGDLTPDELDELIKMLTVEKEKAAPDYGLKLVLAWEIGYLKDIYQKMECKDE